MPKLSLLQSSFSQGEVSEFIDSRVDVAKRFNGARTVENFWPFTEGGVFRRPGTQYICEVKDSSKFTRAVPFEYSTEDAFGIEASEGAFRFIKNRAQVTDSGSPVEIANPYVEADLRDIHYEQSADFLFLTSLNPAVDVQKLARVTDTNWTLADYNAQPPPSFDADENLGVAGAPSANTGTIFWRVGTDQFLAADVGRQIIAGSGRGLITAQTARQLTVTVLDPFSADFTAAQNSLTSVGVNVTSAGHQATAGDFAILTSGAQIGEIRQIVTITGSDTFDIDAAFSLDQTAETWNRTSDFVSGQWALRLAPQTTFDVNLKEPIGARITIGTGAAALRNSYVGKFVKLLGGTIKILTVTSTTAGTGQIMSILTDATTADPAAVVAGAWRLQEASWSATRGRPRTIRAHQGRLVFGGSDTQPTTLWGTNLNDIYNLATGALATDAYEYTNTGGKQNPIQWLESLGSLFIGDAKREHIAKGQGVDAPIGGDETPLVKKISEQGAQHVQAVPVDNAILLLHRFKGDVIQLAYSLQDSADGETFVPSDVTLFARQISDMMFSKHQPAYYQKPNSLVFFPLENGQLGGLTFKPRQEIVAWSRTVTDGEIESVATVPHENGQLITVYLIVKRTINGATKRYWEYFETNSSTVSARGWSDLHTDCAKVGTILAGATTITGLGHLEAKTVDVIIGASAIAQKVVTGGVITLDEAEIPESDTVYEVGLHYDATVTTIRPAVQGSVTEHFKRYWSIAAVRLKNTIGGMLNGKPLKPAGSERIFTGLARMENVRTADDYDGALTITQTQPYPCTILSVSGTAVFADAPG